MKRLYTVKTIRELKRIVSNFSRKISCVSKQFSKRVLKIYCSWSRMNKAELIKVIDYFYSRYSTITIMRKGFCWFDFVKPFKLIKQSAEVLQYSLSVSSFDILSVEVASTGISPITYQKGKYYTFGNCSIFVCCDESKFHLELIGLDGLHLLFKFGSHWSTPRKQYRQEIKNLINLMYRGQNEK